MYFAGLNFSLNHTQGVELIVVSTTLFQLGKAIRDQKWVNRIAETQRGAVDTSAASLVGHIVIPIHALALALPPIIYIGAVTANGLVPPAWVERWRLPFEIGVGEEAWVRTAACAASVGLSVFMRKLLNVLGKQWHYIGVSDYCCLRNFNNLSHRFGRITVLSPGGPIVLFATPCTGQFS
jgi:hypothetical protein